MKKIKVLIIIMIVVANLSIAQKNKYPFEVKKSGSGSKNIVFIPGFSCSGDVWNETKILFEKEYTCYVLTMAGFAGATPQETITFEYWKQGIAQYIKNEKINQPIIIGHSMGGGLAMALAADYPDLIQKIVVVDALPCLSSLMNPKFKAEEKSNCPEMEKQMHDMSKEQFYTMQLQSAAALIADTSKHQLMASWSIKSDKTTFAKMYCDFLNTDLRQKISTVKCPSLILLEPSFLGVKETIEKQYANLKTANLQYASKGLHFIMYDDVAWYNQQLISFLK
jgi:pimeloyl-ACP methyl ester carboxylesterase